MVDGFLAEFVITAGKALEDEDKDISAIGQSRREIGGIRRIDSERFFQSIVWKAAYRKWPCRMECRLGGTSYDLVVFEAPDYRTPSCVFEMKNWLETGGPKVRDIQRDIERLKQCPTNDSALVVFSANNRGVTDRQRRSFERDIFEEARDRSHEIYSFPIVYTNGTLQEFWVAAWPIKSAPNASLR